MRVVPLAALLPILAAPWPASATGETQIGPEEILELRINGQSEGATLLVRRDADGALLVRDEDLPALRLKPPPDGIVLVEGSAYVRVGTPPGAQLHYDAATQSVDLSLPPEAFEPTVATHAAGAPGPATISPGAFLNYDFFTERVAGQGQHGALVELGVFGRPGVVTHSALAQDDAGRSGATRLDSTWTRDLPERLETLRVGDAISGARCVGPSGALRRRQVRYQLRNPADACDHTAAIRAGRGAPAIHRRRTRERSTRAKQGRAPGPFTTLTVCPRSMVLVRCRSS